MCQESSLQPEACREVKNEKTAKPPAFIGMGGGLLYIFYDRLQDRCLGLPAHAPTPTQSAEYVTEPVRVGGRMCTCRYLSAPPGVAATVGFCRCL